MARPGLREWALKGAEQRLVEIAAEAARIYAEFPELRDSQPATEARADRPTQMPRRRKRRSLASRQRMAEAQRKRWAAVKAKRASGSSKDSAGASVTTKTPRRTAPAQKKK